MKDGLEQFYMNDEAMESVPEGAETVREYAGKLGITLKSLGEIFNAHPVSVTAWAKPNSGYYVLDNCVIRVVKRKNVIK